MSDTFDAAQEALAASFSQEESTDQPTPEDASQATPPVEDNIPPSKEVDLSHLPEEAQIYIRARERELQGDATRKWQEAAELRRQAEQSVQFVERLNQDPMFAKQVYDHLNQNLAAAGYLGTPGAVDDDDDIYFDDDGSNPLQAEIAEIQQWRADMEEQMLMAQINADIDNQIAAVRSANPKWDDQDIEAVLDLGFSTQGNLIQAAEVYKSIQDRSLAQYLERKSSVEAPPVVQGSQGATQQSAPPRTDEELRQAALERIRAELG